MRSRYVLVLLATVPMLVLPPPPAARATSAGGMAFEGTMTTAAPVLAPCFPTIGDCPGTAPVTVVTITGTDFLVPIGGGATGFLFATNVCVGGALASKPGVPVASAPLCIVTAAGTLFGHCGLAHGTGFLTVTVVGGFVLTVGFQWFDVGGAGLIVSDPIPTMGSAIVGAMHAVPFPVIGLPPANTCVTGATTFVVSGSAAFVDVT